MEIRWKIGIAFLLVAGVILFCLAINEYLFQVSKEWIREYAKDWDSSFTTFVLFYTDAGTLTLSYLCLVYAVICGPKMRVLFILNAVGLSDLVNSVFKLAHHELRPAWTIHDIKIIFQNRSYGNPSGHACITTAFIVGALLIYLRDNTDMALSEAEKRACSPNLKNIFQSPIMRLLISVVICLLLLFVMYSRLYIGAHSLNQLIYGCLMGLAVLVIVFFLFREEQIAVFKRILPLDSGLPLAPQLLLCTLALALSWSLCVALAFILSQFGIKVDRPTVEHVEKYIQYFNAQTPLEDGYYGSELCHALMAVYYGIILGKKCFAIDPTRTSLLVRFSTRIVRVGIAGLATMAFPSLLLNYLLPYSPYFGVNIFNNALRNMLPFFCYFAFGERIMILLGLLPGLSNDDKAGNENAHMAQLENLSIE